MSLMEILTLLTVILMLLSLIVDAVRLTVEVIEKFSQCKNDGNKKRLTATVSPNQRSILIVEQGADHCGQRLFYL